jgi:hypothetical protein
MAVLAIISVVDGHLKLALAFAGLKAVMVGFGYMELRSAAYAHAVSFTLAMLALAGGLMLAAA